MLSQSEIKSWRNKGYILKKNLFNKNIIEKCHELLKNRSPDKGFGSNNGELQFPSNTVLDKITLNETLICCIEQLLSTDKILLTQCDTWSKGYSEDNTRFKNTDQRIHMDYGNNTFLHPPSWDCSPECVSAIIYFSDTKVTGGKTAVVEKTEENTLVPYTKMPGQGKYPFFNDRKQSEKYFKDNHTKIYLFRKNLYDNEMLIEASPGDILFYRLDIWHRGTPVYKNKTRHVMNLVWKKRECYWIMQWNSAWTQKLYYGWFEKIFIGLNPKQRSVLGVPEPGSKYWNMETLNNLKSRYRGIDLIPYLSKL